MDRLIAPVALASALALAACGPAAAAGAGSSTKDRVAAAKRALAAAALPEPEKKRVAARIDAGSDRFAALLDGVLAARAADPMLFARVDKSKALPAEYRPSDLVGLDGSGISVGREGHRLRRPAFEALRAMSKAARAAGVELLVYSSFRSYEYQAEVFARNVAEDGEERARRTSAEPGKSQHQLGTALDFGPISDGFASTRAGAWAAKEAGRFGFSLSFPPGMEGVTGFAPESWHYRFIGKDAVALQDEFFGGMQAYLVEFLEALR